jgi:hypothetical protein
LRAATGAVVGGNITAKRNILKDVFGSSGVDKMKIPKHMLDQYAMIKSYVGIMHSESNLNRMKNQIMTAKFLGEIEEEAHQEIKKTKRMVAEEMLKGTAEEMLKGKASGTLLNCLIGRAMWRSCTRVRCAPCFLLYMDCTWMRKRQRSHSLSTGQPLCSALCSARI